MDDMVVSALDWTFPIPIVFALFVAGIGTASGLIWLALATRPRLPDARPQIDPPEPPMSYPQPRS